MSSLTPEQKARIQKAKAESYRVLFTGSRYWSCESTVLDAIARLKEQHPRLWIGVGDCKTGLDKIVANIDVSSECWASRYFANWKNQDLSAGPNRNRFMVQDLQPHLAMGFMVKGRKNAGTRNCIQQVRRYIKECTILVYHEIGGEVQNPPDTMTYKIY
jgi:hypothetical protein